MSDWDDDDIGYGRPPKWTRFREGQSGNPKGRPKKKESRRASASESEADEVLRRTLQRKIQITEGGVTREVTMHEAIQRSQAVHAASGNSIATRDILKAKWELEKRDAERATAASEEEQNGAVRKAKEQNDRFEHFAAMKLARAEEWNAAISAGKKEPDFPWPHPDDIMINHSKRVYRLRGPFQQSDVSLYLWVRALRDLYYFRFIRTSRSRSKRNRAQKEFWALVCSHHDVLLPKRWQLSEDAEQSLSKMIVMPLRELDRLIATHERLADQGCALNTNPEKEKANYRFANGVMKPLLKDQGYRSLAEFERAFEDHKGNPPWPNRR